MIIFNLQLLVYFLNKIKEIQGFYRLNQRISIQRLEDLIDLNKIEDNI